VTVVRNDLAERAVMYGDLSRLSEEERLNYYRAVCESLGLNPLTRPFEYLRLSGRLVLYATRAATDQLRQIHGVTVEIVDQKQIGDLFLVHVRARTRDGRQDEDVGAISIAGLKGDDLANAILKCITKAKRRVTLSICGLGWLDESEIETIPGAERVASAFDAAVQSLPAESDPFDKGSNGHTRAGEQVLAQLTDKQRAYFTALCQKFAIDPATLIKARQIDSAQGVSTLIDLLRFADKPFPDADRASKALTAICDRFNVPVSEAAQLLEQQFGWGGDLEALVRGWAFWLEAELYRRQSVEASQSEDTEQDDTDPTDPNAVVV
jgi:hypothetical protein